MSLFDIVVHVPGYCSPAVAHSGISHPAGGAAGGRDQLCDDWQRTGGQAAAPASLTLGAKLGANASREPSSPANDQAVACSASRRRAAVAPRWTARRCHPGCEGLLAYHGRYIACYANACSAAAAAAAV